MGALLSESREQSAYVQPGTMRTLLPLLWALLLGRGLNAVPPTLSTYDEGEGEDAGPGGGEGE